MHMSVQEISSSDKSLSDILSLWMSTSHCHCSVCETSRLKIIMNSSMYYLSVHAARPRLCSLKFFARVPENLWWLVTNLPLYSVLVDISVERVC